MNHHRGHWPRCRGIGFDPRRGCLGCLAVDGLLLHHGPTLGTGTWAHPSGFLFEQQPLGELDGIGPRMRRKSRTRLLARDEMDQLYIESRDCWQASFINDWFVTLVNVNCQCVPGGSAAKTRIACAFHTDVHRYCRYKGEISRLFVGIFSYWICTKSC